MSRLIQVFEYEKLTADTVCTRGEKVGIKIIDKLLHYNDVNKNIYFEGQRNGLKFKNFVGVIQIGNTTIEILPKADKLSNDSAQKKIWHSILLDMLRHCRKIKVDAITEASLRKKNHSLLDLYFELFINEVKLLMQQGLIKKYDKESSNVTALKGRLEFSNNIQQNLVRNERFFTNHQVYNQDHLINQILLRAIKVLKKITYNSYLQDSINRLLINFPEVCDIQINSSHFDKIVLNRKTQSYSEALKIAKLILLNYSPDIKGGDENMLALLFDMNKLWEEYIYRMLLKNNDKSITVKFQNRKHFWNTKVIKPDIIVNKTFEKNGNQISKVFVIDTKWKIREYNQPDDDDLKQMYAYNMYWNSDRSMLLYPTIKVQTTSFGTFHLGKTDENSCKLGFINLIDSTGKLDFKIGEKILSFFEFETVKL